MSLGARRLHSVKRQPFSSFLGPSVQVVMCESSGLTTTAACVLDATIRLLIKSESAADCTATPDTSPATPDRKA
jgi:hypothetical protein